MFKFNWVLSNKLAVGSYPKTKENFNKLNNEKIKSILCLCYEEEAKVNVYETYNFNFNRFPMPDHRNGILPSKNLIHNAVNLLDSLMKKGPVFVHCYAGIERSPLICMAWLVKFKKLTSNEALQYIMQVNPGTNPLPGQFNILDSFTN